MTARREVEVLAGDGAVLVGPAGVVVLAGGTAALLETLWHAVGVPGHTGEHVLHALVEARAWELPALAVVWPEPGHCTVLVRGHGVVRADGEDAEIAAPGVSTWREEAVPRTAALTLSLDGATAEGGPWRITAGCVPGAGVVAWTAPTFDPARPAAAADRPIEPDPAVGPADADAGAAAPVPGREFDFGALLDQTADPSIEAAAVRPAADQAAPDQAAPGQPPPGQPAPGQPAPPTLAPPITPRPVLLRRLLHVDGGPTETVDGPLALGRRPPAGHLLDGLPARAVRLADPDHALSRLHAEIRVVGERVTVTDCGSVNGTIVVPPGGVPHRLTPRQPFELDSGAVLRLGGALTLRYEVVPA